ncbi:VirB3 family type IV secretion system protein [Xanthomonas euvesicatoria pv. allii]|uniref:type IV secretion system protein VirB3 n=1 Tax=Xanthomonas euvesicatoria TaxID=456327 RepID=UPI0024049217|nr:VirB3 family type IV secretion system protein [Xanthomonas euvesicatoria]MCP3050735.1 VirB3 family type IV secretion system protein [Xanthomonas euvesicatoria pv. allii]
MEDPLFKGCTRPAMLVGVPIVPMVMVNGVLFILGLLLHPGIWVLNVVAIVIMRIIVKEDDQRFRLLFLRLVCRVVRPNRNAHHWKCSAYAPITFARRKKS